MSQKYYLDTSAHVERHAGETAVRRKIESSLAGGQHATSTHVKREWIHITYASAVAILNACEGAEDVGDVRARLRHGFGRQPAHHVLALDMLCADATSVHDIAIRTEQFLRARADVFFELDIAEIRDGSECMLARETARPELRTGRWEIRTKCSRDECQCEQIAFTDAHAVRIDDAAGALAASNTPGHPKMARIAREALAHPDKTRRKGKACWGGSGLGGDLSIAMECGGDEILMTTDRSFDEICPAIGVGHVRLAGTRIP